MGRKGPPDGGMNTAPGPRGRNHRGTLAEPSPGPERAAAPRANGTTKKEAKRSTDRREEASAHGVVVKHRGDTGTTDQPPPATGAPPERHKIKAPIKRVMHTLTHSLMSSDPSRPSRNLFIAPIDGNYQSIQTPQPAARRAHSGGGAPRAVELRHGALAGGLVPGVERRHVRRAPAAGGHQAG